MKRILEATITLFVISIFSLSTVSAEIIEHHNETLLSINDQVAIKNYESGGVNFREISLAVTNNSSIELKNIKLTLLGISTEATITKNEISIDTLPPGVAYTSQGVCSFNIKNELIDQSEVKFTWQVQYDQGTLEQFVDEVLIGEVLSN